MSIISQTSVSKNTPDILIPGVTCDGSVNIGDWVRIDSMTIATQALADSADHANVFGLVEDKSGSVATVRVAGVSGPIFSGLDTTKEYLLSNTSPGEMNPEGIGVPSTPGHVVLILGKPMTDSRFLVRVGSRMVRS